MKFTPEVIAALTVLREHAENDFERHRLDVLERDLSAPPVVEIVDDTHQRFNGITYRQSTSGHYSVNRLIHRVVWSYYHGEISQGNYNIHHIDGNPANNDISNLQLLTSSEHRKFHNGTPLIKRTCPACGKTFFVKQTSRQQCCSIQCANQIKPHKPISYVEKICAVCGKKFTVPYELRKQKSCSKSCANKLRSLTAKPPVEKICPVCNKTFTLRYPSDQIVCCSRSCGAKLRCQKKKSST